MKNLNNLVQIAVNLNEALSTQDRYNRLLSIIRESIPYDASTLMIYENDSLIPVASFGLVHEASEKRYSLKDNPRLDIIFNSKKTVRFPLDCDLPDPFDGFLISDPRALDHVHSCLGCPLIVENKTIGVLTADSLSENAFDHIDDAFLNAIAALAGATLRTSRILESLEEAAKLQGMVAKELMAQVSTKGGGELIGTGPQIKRLKEDMKLVAKSDLAVLVTGETGTGKELVARGVHAFSNRSEKPLIYVNCAALPESIAESELFGHKKGSFTGAIQDRLGKFEVANGGTLFLDEIGELPLSIQAKLLRAIQEGEIQRVGEDKIRKVDVRVIAATNRNLEDEMTKGHFRSDLYHRLNVFTLRTPALRDHLHDVPLLVSYFTDYYQRRLGCKPFRISETALNILKEYQWPGNVRELRNLISRATLHASQDASPEKRFIMIEPHHLHLSGASSINPERIQKKKSLSEVVNLQDALTEFKKEVILAAVKRHDGNWSRAASDLGLHRSNLYHLRDQLRLKYP